MEKLKKIFPAFFILLALGTSAWGQHFSPFLTQVAEEAGVNDERYIAPNEFDFYRFDPALKGKRGAVIGVGTFRVLHDFVGGDFTHAVFLDYSIETSAYNRQMLETLATSRDRFEFIARLTNKTFPESLVKDAKNGKVSTADFLAHLLTQAKLEAQVGQTNQSLQVLRAITLTANDPKAWDRSIFGSDHYFSRAQSGAISGRFAVIRGSLAGAEAMRTLGDALRDAKVNVAAVDLSNALEHLMLLPKEESRVLAQNLRKLPWDANGVVLHTVVTGATADLPHQNTWSYHSWKYDPFIRKIEKGAIDSRWNYSHFVERASREADPAMRDHGLIETEDLTPFHCKPQASERTNFITLLRDLFR